jgi:pyruvate,water dikinase
MNTFILPLEPDVAAPRADAGGKGASLLWLAGHGFHTAPGFIVTTAAFHEFARCAAIDFHRLKENSDRLQTGNIESSIPQAVEESIREAYQRLGGKVAVRSSMVNEDSGESSFAGQLDTFLNMEGGDEVLQAVASCWISMLNPRLITYLRERDTEHKSSMAVIVQRMVEAKAAGVAFSIDPISGEDHVVIEATHGLGDAVAGGTVNPDHWEVDSQGTILEAIQHSLEAAALNETQIIELAGIVRHLAGKAGSPQDVEWAWDGGTFIILQTRPITSLVDRDVYSNKFVSEMVPGLIKPLVWSTTTSAITHNVFAFVFDELLGRGRVDASKLVRRIHSRLYANVTLLGRACEQLGLPANFFETITRGERPTNVRRSFLSFDNLPEKFRLMRFVFRNSRAAQRISSFVCQRHLELEPFRTFDPAPKTTKELLALLAQLREYHGEVQWYIFITALNMSVRNRMLGRMVQRAAPQVVVGDLLRGADHSQALQANIALQALADTACELDEATQKLVLIGDDAMIRAELSKTGIGEKLILGMDGFISRHGFLSANGTDFSLPAWRETPNLLWQMVGRMAKQPPVPASEAGDRQRVAYRQVKSKLSLFHRRRFERLLASTAIYMDLRERVSRLISEDAHLMRRIYLALADRLTGRNQLNQRDDIFFLSHEEVIGMVRGQVETEDAKRLIAARRADMEKDAELDPPETLRGDRPTPRLQRPIADPSDVLIGISGSTGVVRGRARIVRDPSLAPADLSRDDILVVPFTDVGWTPLLAGIGGIVAETGGQLSHTAIVAREYGLPAVVSVKRATQRVHEGEWILVDGDEGRVYLKQEAHP